MSELGAIGASHPLLTNTLGSPLLGLMLVMLAPGLWLGTGGGRWCGLGALLIVVSGVSLAMTGVFRCDAGCVDISAASRTHSVFATVSAVAMSVAPLPISYGIRTNPRWRNYGPYCLATAILTLGLSAVYSIPSLENLGGLLQRVSMGTALVWVEVMSLKLLKESQARTS